MASAGLRLDQVVDVREDNGRVVIEPLKREEHNLADLLEGITPDNIHKKIDFRTPVGNEAL